jgi:hypothetical protein
MFDNLGDEQKKTILGKMKGIIAFDTLDDLDGFRGDVEEFAGTVGLPVVKLETIGLDGLKDVVTEAMQRKRADS